MIHAQKLQQLGKELNQKQEISIFTRWKYIDRENEICVKQQHYLFLHS